jgi:hypothetical protein
VLLIRVAILGNLKKIRSLGGDIESFIMVYIFITEALFICRTILRHLKLHMPCAILVKAVDNTK